MEKRVRKTIRAESFKRSNTIRQANIRFLQKTLIILLIILIGAIIVISIVLIVKKEKPAAPEGLEGELKSLWIAGLEEGSISLPQNCSNESFKAVWNEIFEESAEGSVILKNETYGGNDCPYYAMYKIKNNEEVWLLGEIVVPFFFEWRVIVAYYLNATPEFINNLTSRDFNNFYNFTLPKNESAMARLIKNRTIQNSNEASDEFSNKYKMIPGTWLYTINENGSGYSFNATNQVNENFMEMLGGAIADNYSMDLCLYMAIALNLPNNPPVFLSSCENISIMVNTTYNLNMKNCFNDSDGDNLTFRYFALGCTAINMSINRSGDNLTLAPQINWMGNCSLSIYANDSKNETRGEVRVVVTNYSVNSPPVFQSSCEDIDFHKNTNHTIKMGDCFSDLDNNSLTFTYTNMSIRNISIIRNGSNLTFVPQINFVGKGYFNITAYDGTNTTLGRAGVDVKEPNDGDDGDGDGGGDGGGGECTSQNPNVTCGSWVCGVKKNNCNNSVVCGNCTAGKTCVEGACVIPATKITSSSPPGSEINITSNRSLTFSINAENYNVIEWYVDGALVKTNASSYEVKNLSAGSYEIKAMVKKGSAMDYKTWKLNVSKVKADERKLLLYVMIGLIVLVVVVLVVIIIIKFSSKKAPSTTSSLFEVREKPRDDDKTGKTFEKQVQPAYVIKR